MRSLIKRLAWSLRKLRLPIYNRGLILEVGSGGNPHPFSNVLVEKYIDDTHRYHSISIDRPIVLADASHMPFRDNEFDYIFAFHVLEHIPDPRSFLNELERVGKAGYIETPNAFYERIDPLDMHLLEIFDVDNSLHIYKKQNWKHDEFISNLDLFNNNDIWNKIFKNNPEILHVCYKWENKINYEIVNEDMSLEWFDSPDTEVVKNTLIEENLLSEKNSLPRVYFNIVLKRMRELITESVNLDSILVCPDCKNPFEGNKNEYYNCVTCDISFQRLPIPDFNNPLSGLK